MTYLQISKVASWTLLFGTMLMAFLVVFAVASLSMMFALIRHMFGMDGHPLPLTHIGWSLAAVILPALFLTHFYFVSACGTPSPTYRFCGWTASAVYHGAMTAVFTFIPATVQSSNSSVSTPVAFWTGSAMGVSLYLLLRYPRPPKLPMLDEESVRLRP